MFKVPSTLPLKILSLTLVGLFSSTIYAQNSGTLKQEEELRSDPQPTASSAGKLAASTKIEIVERKGFWTKIKSGTNTGWVKISSISLDSTNSGGVGSTIAGLASGRLGSGNVVSAAGTRGLSAEELKSSKPDTGALARVKKFAVTASDSSSFAKRGNLEDRQVPYIGTPPETK